jgi:hypothetical protein
MVLPLAPGKRISSIRMPLAVCVSQASTPPARIKITPAIAKDHLRRTLAFPCPRALNRPVSPFCSFVLFVIDTVTESRARASGLA